MSKRDYYEVLGLSKQATDAEIKKAYKKLAIKWHPDKNLDNKEEAVKMFRDIAQAYQYLSDPEKRKIYDTYGHSGPKGYSGSQGFNCNFTSQDADDLFKHFFSRNMFDTDDDTDFISKLFSRNNRGKDKNDRGDFFSSSMGGFGSMGGLGSFAGMNGGFTSSFSSSSSFGTFGGSMGSIGAGSHSVSTSTRIANGKTVTTKKTTVVNKDGSRTVSQEVIENGVPVKSSNYSLTSGQSKDKRFSINF